MADVGTGAGSAVTEGETPLFRNLLPRAEEQREGIAQGRRVRSAAVPLRFRGYAAADVLVTGLAEY